MSTQVANVLCRELAACQVTFTENRVLANRMAGAVTIEQFNWQPAADQWSVAQCLVHLIASAELYAVPIETAIRQGWRDGLLGSGPFRYGLLSRWMLHAVSPTNPQKYQASTPIVPAASTYQVHAVLTAFDTAGARWERLLHAANGLDLARTEVRSPETALLTIPIGALFEIQAAHERRHLLQAQRVLVSRAVGLDVPLQRSQRAMTSASLLEKPTRTVRERQVRPDYS